MITESRGAGENVVLTGHVEAQNEANYGFRIDGRMIERLVNVGDNVKPNQLLARLDQQNEQNAVRSAQAARAAANANLTQTSNQYDRQKQLLRNGFTTRAQYDQAEQAFLAARSQVEDTEARLQMANDRLGYTELKTDTAGVVTERRAESGEVVRAGQPIVVVARQDGRDAVFEVPGQLIGSTNGDPDVQVSLTEIMHA